MKQGLEMLKQQQQRLSMNKRCGPKGSILRNCTFQSLESTRRMTDLVHGAKEAGIRSLVLIDEHGEQLDRIEDDMNQINEDMEDAEKNLEGLQKCCGLCVLPWKRPQMFRRGGDYENTWRLSEDGKLSSDRRRVAAGRNTNSKGPIITRITNDEREDEMEQNLTNVGYVLGNLREMAIDMGSEIEYQNKQLDRINFKTQSNDWRIQMANRELQKSLRKINNI
ncbi:synaptosomal-associated protein 25-like [Saccostrea echinata]|uniref:synaptosomal-associated protein 25-like n=1 Tax=Saccostrea echinata TaxID=191078 RepID=UPI002A7F4DA8|nr:synaptosomal-associated protein 25-like [Saccostrea echinata]